MDWITKTKLSLFYHTMQSSGKTTPQPRCIFQWDIPRETPMVQYLRSKDAFHAEMSIPNIYKYLGNKLQAFKHARTRYILNCLDSIQMIAYWVGY